MSKGEKQKVEKGIQLLEEKIAWLENEIKCLEEDLASPPSDPGQVQSVDSSGIVVSESGRMVALVGVHDIVVVETDDALLVTTAERAQDVKRVVEALKAAGRTELV